MKWILIILVTSGGGKPAATTAEFNTEVACRDALVELQKRWGSSAQWSFCAPKGGGT